MRIAEKEKQNRQQNAIKDIKSRIKPGVKLYTIVTHVARSRMSRNIAVLCGTKTGDVLNISGQVADVLGWTWVDSDAVKVSGVGMDMCFKIVYELSMKLFGDGYAITSRKL